MSIELVLSAAARDVIERLRAERSGPLTMVIGNGCCDSTAPFVFEHYMQGPNEAKVAELDGGLDVLLDRQLLGLFDGTEVVIDAIADAGGDSFSAESELGLRLTLTRMPAQALPARHSPDA